jgi:hypothetical protein
MDQFIWCCIRDAFGWTYFPTSIQQILCKKQPRRLGIPQRIVFFFFVGLAWAIWKNRNKMGIEKVFPSYPAMVIYKSIKFLQMWGDLVKENDQGTMKNLVKCLEDWIRKKIDIPDVCSDVVFL